MQEASAFVLMRLFQLMHRLMRYRQSDHLHPLGHSPLLFDHSPILFAGTLGERHRVSYLANEIHLIPLFVHFVMRRNRLFYLRARMSGLEIALELKLNLICQLHPDVESSKDENGKLCLRSV